MRLPLSDHNPFLLWLKNASFNIRKESSEEKAEAWMSQVTDFMISIRSPCSMRMAGDNNRRQCCTVKLLYNWRGFWSRDSWRHSLTNLICCSFSAKLMGVSMTLLFQIEVFTYSEPYRRLWKLPQFQFTTLKSDCQTSNLVWFCLAHFLVDFWLGNQILSLVFKHFSVWCDIFDPLFWSSSVQSIIGGAKQSQN